MTILVDEAVWPWRGNTWCHLVSDSDLDELHEFARRLGCRRIGFQGDHYDIDVETRLAAIAIGAQACTSRELLRRLKAAGLRLRPSTFEKWELLQRWSPPMPGFQTLGDDAFGPWFTANFTAVLPTELGASNPNIEGAFALKRRRAAALIVHGNTSPPPIVESPESGIYHRGHEDGLWAVELVYPPLAATE